MDVQSQIKETDQLLSLGQGRDKDDGTVSWDTAWEALLRSYHTLYIREEDMRVLDTTNRAIL